MQYLTLSYISFLLQSTGAKHSLLKYWITLNKRLAIALMLGGATLETVRAYVDAQGTDEHARKKSKSL